MKTRREAREWVMKVLYAHEFSGNPLEIVVEQLQPPSNREAQMKFALDLAFRMNQQREYLDKIIQEHADKWKLERIAALDRIILRMAICEILFFEDIPAKASINEAIEIAKKYSTEKSSKFINGILDAVLHQSAIEKEVVSPSSPIQK